MSLGPAPLLEPDSVSTGISPASPDGSETPLFLPSESDSESGRFEGLNRERNDEVDRRRLPLSELAVWLLCNSVLADCLCSSRQDFFARGSTTIYTHSGSQSTNPILR